MENKTTEEKKGSILRNVYFYLASLVTLGIVVGSLIFMINLGLKTWVFTGAEPVSYRLGQPPILYFDQAVTNDISTKPVVGVGAIDCTDGCTLTDVQNTNITEWKESYKSWLDNKANPNTGRLRDLINGLSFFIVAFPIFIIHYRIVQREAKRGEPNQHNPIRPAYFYFVSLASLVMVVVASGFLLNLTLKTWVFPSVGEIEKNINNMVTMPDEYSISGVQSLVTCGDTCKLDAETVTLAEQWVTDYNSWNSSMNESYDNSERQAASTIPFILLGIPLFWYHWVIARNKKKSDQETPVSTEKDNK